MNNIIAEKRFISDRLGVPYENLSQSYLRAETALPANTSLSNIPFTIQTNKVSLPIITERLLDLNDEFVITHFTVGLKDLTGGATDTDQLEAVVQTYADANVFSASHNGLYNGSLSFTIDRKEFIPQFPVRAFRRVPITQADGVAVINEFDNGLFGFYCSEPVLINGRQTININIDLGTVLAFGANPSSIVFEVRGYLLVNAKS